MIRFFLSLWRGELPLARVFWEYMIAWGTLINLLTTGASLIALVKQTPSWIILVLHFAATPLNVLLLVSVWRAAQRECASSFAPVARIGAALWFAIMLVI